MNNNVTNPSHYTDGKIEVIDFIEDKKLGFCKGNAIKYIARAGKKDSSKEIEDLEKAVWYLNREIKALKSLQPISYKKLYEEMVEIGFHTKLKKGDGLLARVDYEDGIYTFKKGDYFTYSDRISSVIILYDRYDNPFTINKSIFKYVFKKIC
jgi:hypothetical protein